MRKLETMSDWLSISTEGKIVELTDYLNTSNKQFTDIGDAYYKKVEAEAQRIKDEREKDEYYDWMLDDFWRYTETFPRILLNAFHVTSYTLLETETIMVAKRIRRKQKQIFDVSEIKANGNLEAAVSYIKKLTAIDAKTFNSWNDIKDAQRLRNSLVHSNGHITDNQDAINAARKHNVLNESMIDISGKPILVVAVTYDYCRIFLDTIMAFFGDLYGAIKKNRVL